MKIKDLVNYFSCPPTDPKLEILGVVRKIKGVTKLTSINYRLEIGHYYKVFFQDKTILIVIPKLSQVQFSQEGDLGATEGVDNNEIGGKKVVKCSGNQYKIENANDYQYVLELNYGNFEDVEGECYFSDYININDPNDTLSLGINSHTQKRSDVRAKTINLNDIKIINN